MAFAIKMRRPVVFGAAALALLLAVLAWRRESSDATIPFQAKTRPIEPPPLTPWREPAADLPRFFPNATGYELETRVLSGRRLELAEHLGRPPSAEETALRIYRVYHENTPLGTVVTRRVKGTFGAIEMALAVGTNGAVRSLRLQRLREPEGIARILQDPDWLGAFIGKRADNFENIEEVLLRIPAEARPAAAAVAEGTRSLLILLAAADEGPAPAPRSTRHH